jgi:hypothetical protein
MVAHVAPTQLGAMRGRVTRSEDDLVVLKSAASCCLTAYQALMSGRRRDAMDQARLAKRLLAELETRESYEIAVGRDLDRNRAVGQQRYRDRVAAGLCPRCGKPKADNDVHCVWHRDQRRDQRRATKLTAGDRYKSNPKFSPGALQRILKR